MSEKIERLEKSSDLVSRWLNWLAIAGMVAMLALTLLDVIGAKLFRWPVPGSFEITELLGLVIIAFALPYTQVLRGHIEVEFFEERLPERVRRIVATFISLFGVVLFAVLTWQMFDFALTIQLAGRTTATMYIPFFPFTYAAALCFFMVCLLLVVQFLKSVSKVMKK